jgi:signal transduction histidine kinase
LPRVLSRTWWIPLAFVVFALLLLLATPVFVSYRVRHLRNALSDGTDQARVLVNDLEAAIATQLYVRDAVGRSTDPGADSIYAAAVGLEQDDMRALGKLIPSIDAEAMELYADLQTLATDWHAHSDPAVRPSASLGRESEVPGQPTVLRAAQRLDNYLEQVAAKRREEIRQVERMDALLASVLAPLALASAAIVFVVGRRILFFAHAVERDRSALARSIEARAALMRGVTHDVKNPLSAASGYAELLAEGLAGPLTKEQTDMLHRVRRLIGVSVATVSELLELSQAEAGRLRVERMATDLSRLVRETVDDYRASALEKRLQVELSLPENAVEMETDPTRVRQIVANLLSNAIKYTPAGGRIAVRLFVGESPNGKSPPVFVEVRDNGPGIPTDLRDRIFEEFFRVPSTRETANGTGIGLAISRQLARLLDGDITIDDAPEGGAIFRLQLGG